MIFVMRNKNYGGTSAYGFLGNKQSRQNVNLQTKGLTYLLILEVGYFFLSFFLSAFSFFLPDVD